MSTKALFQKRELLLYNKNYENISTICTAKKR